MGAGASTLPTNVDKATAQAFAGAQFDEEAFDAKAIDGVVAKEEILKAAENTAEPPPAPAKSVIDFASSITPHNASLGGYDLRFTFEKKHANDPTPYYLQGDEDLHRTLPTAQRMALRDDARVVRELERFWAVFRAPDISKDQYLSVHTKFAAVLIPDLSAAEARESGEDDWSADAGGAERMNKERFMGCLFELCDMYTTGIDGQASATWLRRLFQRITSRRTLHTDGRVTTRPPTPPTRARRQEFAAFLKAHGLPEHASALTPEHQTADADADADAEEEDEEEEEEEEEEWSASGGYEEEEDDDDDAARAPTDGANEHSAPGDAAAGDAGDATAGGVPMVDAAAGGVVDAGVPGSLLGSSGGPEAAAAEEEVCYEWAADEHVFPLVLYGDAPLESAAASSAADIADADEMGRDSGTEADVPLSPPSVGGRRSPSRFGLARSLSGQTSGLIGGLSGGLARGEAREAGGGDDAGAGGQSARRGPAESGSRAAVLVGSGGRSMMPLASQISPAAAQAAEAAAEAAGAAAAAAMEAAAKLAAGLNVAPSGQGGGETIAARARSAGAAATAAAPNASEAGHALAAAATAAAGEAAGGVSDGVSAPALNAAGLRAVAMAAGRALAAARRAEASAIAGGGGGGTPSAPQPPSSMPVGDGQPLATGAPAAEDAAEPPAGAQGVRAQGAIATDVSSAWAAAVAAREAAGAVMAPAKAHQKWKRQTWSSAGIRDRRQSPNMSKMMSLSKQRLFWSRRK